MICKIDDLVLPEELQKRFVDATPNTVAGYTAECTVIVADITIEKFYRDLEGAEDIADRQRALAALGLAPEVYDVQEIEDGRGVVVSEKVKILHQSTHPNYGRLYHELYIRMQLLRLYVTVEGFAWNDVHFGNIGMADGQLVLIDVGNMHWDSPKMAFDNALRDTKWHQSQLTECA